jgi:hypothetical protein
VARSHPSCSRQPPSSLNVDLARLLVQLVLSVMMYPDVGSAAG